MGHCRLNSHEFLHAEKNNSRKANKMKMSVEIRDFPL